MKLIRGSYEKILRSHESFRNKDYNVGDYFLKYQYPNNFLVDIYVIDEDEEIGIDTKFITTISADRAKKMSCKEIKETIKNKEVL